AAGRQGVGERRAAGPGAHDEEVAALADGAVVVVELAEPRGGRQLTGRGFFFFSASAGSTRLGASAGTSWRAFFTACERMPRPRLTTGPLEPYMPASVSSSDARK